MEEELPVAAVAERAGAVQRAEEREVELELVEDEGIDGMGWRVPPLLCCVGALEAASF